MSPPWCHLLLILWLSLGEAMPKTWYQPRPVLFMRHVDKREDGCWLWTGHISTTGYPRFQGGYAHRRSYEMFVGEIPEFFVVDHLCDKPRCVNPDHLRVCTQRENILRGTAPSAKNAAKTHCKRGHEFTDDNTQIRTDGSRRCRACRRKNGRTHA